jgi:hypothetical protein
MAHRFFILAAFLGVLALLGCSSSRGDGALHASAKEAHPAWLVGSLVRQTQSDVGDVETVTIILDADGTGKWVFDKIYRDLPYADRRDEDSITWTAKDSTLTIDGVDHDLQISPHCRLVEFGGFVYEHSWDAYPEGCPIDSPPLTSTESRFAGSWSGSGDLSGLSVILEDDHSASVAPAGARIRFFVTYSIDDDGTLHGTVPDGTELLRARVRLVNGRLELCDEGGCATLHRP